MKDKRNPLSPYRVLYFKIEWQERLDGKKPLSTYFTSEQLSEFCPKLLLNYYIVNAVLLDNLNAEKKEEN